MLAIGATLLCLVLAFSAAAEPRDAEALASEIMPPFSLGQSLGDAGGAGEVFELLNSGGAHAGYVFETGPIAPLPGFSGAVINALVVIDLEGRFIDVRLLDHNEPIFVSGLGEAPFHAFFEQYRGHAIADSLVVGTPYGESEATSSLVYLDGVTKATASIRIAHESVLAATLAVARERMQGIASGPPASPDMTYDEALDWDTLVRDGIVTHTTVTNAEVQAAFTGTEWEADDPEALEDPDAPYLDLWVVDVTPPAIARAVLDSDTQKDLARFAEVSGDDEFLLVIETARHGLVSEDFVRNTSPDRISAEQDGLPVALRDADLFVDFAAGVPSSWYDGVAMILRTDRRLGFDPSRPWTMEVMAAREHGMFQPTVGTTTLLAAQSTPERFFRRETPPEPVPPWLEALRGRALDMGVLGLLLMGAVGVLAGTSRKLAAHAWFTPMRLAFLAVVVGFVGWWGQGQLSIVTVLGVMRAAVDGGSFAFLAYDPFSLGVWAAAILGFVLWGRGLFCGWLCPYGALQEFAHHLGRRLGLPRIEPSERWEARLRPVKYVVLAVLLVLGLALPSAIDTAAEVEPFKTAITTGFQREWYYLAYALFWLLLGLVLFKGFCRFVCPLGAVMAIGGMIRQRDWIPRREACGSPCQLCKVRCSYGAIKANGRVAYDECFQCLDCVAIHDDPKTCVPLIIAARRKAAGQRRAAQAPVQRPVPAGAVASDMGPA
ncbi:MAG: 4Fe-4S binding protein [Pseudomonadota bacterium]